LLEPNPTAKHLLYAYRVLLTGIHLMQTGEVVANIQVLNEGFRLAEISELVARKRAGAEKMLLDARDHEVHGRLLDRLEVQLQAAHEGSKLPEEPTTAAALDDFVVRLRLDSTSS
jgi:predicted nucleotidyltransferase